MNQAGALGERPIRGVHTSADRNVEDGVRVWSSSVQETAHFIPPRRLNWPPSCRSWTIPTISSTSTVLFRREFRWIYLIQRESRGLKPELVQTTRSSFVLQLDRLILRGLVPTHLRRIKQRQSHRMTKWVIVNQSIYSTAWLACSACITD